MVPEDGAEGVIVAEADEMGGFSLWVDENGCTTATDDGRRAVRAGLDRADPDLGRHDPHAFDADRQERSAGGTVSLYANDEKIGEGRMERSSSFASRVRRHGRQLREGPAG